MSAPPAGGAGGGTEVFEAYFQRADLDRDGRISGSEAVAFLRGSNLPQQILAQIWTYADQNKAGSLGRQEFFNALKLVTVAQSGHALTPEIVKSALYSQASAKIPAPKITSMAAPSTQANPVVASRPPGQVMMPPSPQVGALPPSQYMGLRPQTQSITTNQQGIPSSAAIVRPGQAAPTSYPGVPSLPPASGTNQVPPGAGSVRGLSLANSISLDSSTNWLENKSEVSPVGASMQAPTGATASSQRPSGFGYSPANASGVAPVGPSQLATSPYQPPGTAGLAVSVGSAKQDSKALVPSENGLSSTSNVSNDMFAFSPQTAVNASTVASTASTTLSSSNTSSGISNNPNFVNQGQFGVQSTMISTPGGSQPQIQSAAKQNHLLAMQSISALSASNTTNNPSNSPTSLWPKISQSDVQKYTKVFQDVDKDRDGKITGAEARTLFLSWRLPREVLKQVWDLSDQDNDGMLSLREFCIALYLMERHRAGTSLPTELPDSVIHDETLLRATGLPTVAYNGPAWQQNAALPQRYPGASVSPGAGVRPPLPPHMHPQMDAAAKTAQPKSVMPTSGNHIVNQANKNDQNKTNIDNRGGSDADKKTQVIDKQILDSREKLEYYRTKMQDLVLYKSRCDNRLNEITERAIADKREVESLAKKYEEKYKQVGELASKLAVEEAAFRDVQERKLELHNAVIKMEQGGSADGLLQVRADRIQYQLEELEKALNDRCKHFGLDVKPTTSIELPFGWEPGVQEGSADWNEDWDKFEDEGFAVVKDNGTIENIVSADKPKSSSIWNDDEHVNGFSPGASSAGHSKYQKHFSTVGPSSEGGSVYEQSEEGLSRSPTSPGRSTMDSPFVSSRFGVQDVTSHGKDNYSYHDDAEESVFGDKYGDEQSWNFDDTDTESIWGPSAVNTFDDDHKSSRDSVYGFGDFGVNPIRVDSPGASSNFGRKRSPFFDDSVPASPAFNSGFSPKFSEFNDDSSFGNFGRFDSFRTSDAEASFQSQQFSRFDSVNSSKGNGSFAQDPRFSRFDSINSSKGDEFMRSDSISSSQNFGHSRFDSFDDADPFGSSGPFKSSGSRSPPKY